MLSRIVITPCLLSCLLTSAAVAQTAAPSDGSAMVIRSTTRLVQVSVVVEDKKGNFVTNLKKEDFSISDEGKAQDIAFTITPGPAASANARSLLPPNAFTNRYDLKGEDPGVVTVVLFDTLNTALPDQKLVRKQILSFLQALKPQDHVAVYALTTQLLVLHEFTQDASDLVKAVNHFSPKELAAFDASHPAFVDVPALGDDPMWKRSQDRVNQANAEVADQNKINRASATASAIEAIADHVAAIPGRKNLVWVTGGFPLQIISEIIAPDRQTVLMSASNAEALQALNRVNMAIYPVDASGVATSPNMDPSQGFHESSLKCADCNNQSPSPTPAIFERQDLRDSERSLADATGGQAFYGSNDIRAALRRAFDDGRFAYTLGFYPNHGKWDGKYRKIKVRVKLEGAKLRYRGGYYAEAETPHTDEAQAKLVLQQAAAGPLEATSLGMIVTGKPGADRKVEFHVALDPKQLALQTDDHHRKGAVDMYFLQRDAKQQILSAENQRISLDFEEKQYDSLARTGLVLARHLAISPQAADVRIFVRDAATAALGSVTIPVSALMAPAPALAKPN